jgi:hypothetical protein
MLGAGAAEVYLYLGTPLITQGVKREDLLKNMEKIF